MKMKRIFPATRAMASVAILLSAVMLLPGCNDDDDSDSTETITDTSETTDPVETSDGEVVDITDAIFTNRSADCADYDNTYDAFVLDITENTDFEANVLISSDADSCTFVSDAIPNHDFNDETAAFGGEVIEQELEFTVSRNPAIADAPTPLTQETKNAIMLNGVVLDIVTAGCYDPSNPDANEDGNTGIGCPSTSAWLLDGLGSEAKFGADAHNAHVQPGGQYHYHGSPLAMYDDNPGPDGSPVIGFAADGFPIYGSYFYDSDTGAVRKAMSGYTLKEGSRVAVDGLNPGGEYDGNYVDDWAFTDAGDLDECNGMTVDGQYGYYAIDTFPWVMNCFSGTPDESFTVTGGGGPPPM